jgi:hypothetical protein
MLEGLWFPHNKFARSVGYRTEQAIKSMIEEMGLRRTTA